MIEAEINLGKIPRILRNQAIEVATPLLRDFIDKEGRAAISSSGKVPGLVQVTAPYGDDAQKGQAAKKQGERSVVAGIRQVYATPGKAYKELAKINRGLAGRFYALAKKKRWEEANEILRKTTGLPSWMKSGLQAFDDGAAHRKRRNRRGRVSGRTPSLLVANAVWIKRYEKEKKAWVGLLASGWVADAGKIGNVRGVPAWVKRHSSGFGVVRKDASRSGYRVTVQNTAFHATRDLQRKANYVERYRMKAMVRQLPYIRRAIEKRLDSALRAA